MMLLLFIKKIFQYTKVALLSQFSMQLFLQIQVNMFQSNKKINQIMMNFHFSKQKGMCNFLFNSFCLSIYKVQNFLYYKYYRSKNQKISKFFEELKQNQNQSSKVKNRQKTSQKNMSSINQLINSQNFKEKSIVIFQSVGGNDKGPDGYRKDSFPIRDAITKFGWYCEIIKFENQKAEQIFIEVSNRFCAYIGRINPGTFSDNQKTYFEVLRRLSAVGLIGMTHPDSMIKLGSKSTLVDLKQTGLVPSDTFAYSDNETFKKQFHKSLFTGDRVLKQNRGSTGQGIWKVSIEDQRLPFQRGQLPVQTKIKITEAADNHTQRCTLGKFMDFCQKYITQGNSLVDMKYLPRIKEGQIRILMVGQNPVFVVHKKPTQNPESFSATLFSGAKYRYDSPKKWQNIVDFFLGKLPEIKQIMNQKQLPLFWTADFILDYGMRMEDIYVLGEINCSCVGFTSQLDLGIQDMIAEQAIRQASIHRAKTQMESIFQFDQLKERLNTTTI